MSDINRIILIGRLTRDPELKYTPSGAAVATFSLACSKTYSQNGERKEQVSYFDVVAWNKLGETIVEYVKKGHRLAIEGRLSQRRWQDDNGQNKSKIEVIAENIQFLQGKSEAQQQEPAAKPDSIIDGTPVTDPDFDNPFSDDDIPF